MAHMQMNEDNDGQQSGNNNKNDQDEYGSESYGSSEDEHNSESEVKQSKNKKLVVGKKRAR